MTTLNLQQRRGFVMPLVIFAIVVMAIFAASTFRTASDTRRTGWGTRGSGLALYTAEGGMRKTLGQWPAGAAALASGGTLDLGWQSLPNGATYHAVIGRVDNGGANGLQMYRVTVEGRTRPGVSGRSTITQMVGGVPVFVFGVFTQNGVTLGGSSLDDSYDSDLGAYGLATSDSAGDIASNGNVSTASGSKVEGNILSHGTVVASGVVTGTITQNAPPIDSATIMNCPPGGYTPAAQLTGTGISYNPTTGVLNVSGASGKVTLTAPPTSYHFKSVTLSGGATLEVITGGQHMDIFVEELVDLSGSSIMNTGAKSTELQLASCGDPTLGGTVTPKTWKLSGSAGAFYTAYAPKNPVDVSGTGQIWGAIIADRLTTSGSAKIHYDKATARQSSKTFMTLRGSWAQQLR